MRKSVVDSLADAPPHLTYHNLAHTFDVLEQVERIAAAESATTGELLLLQAAALFHDIGYLNGAPKDHEQRGCAIFSGEASARGLSVHEVEIIHNLIMATKIPQSPSNKLEQIICDADLDYLGRDDFPKLSEGLKKEFLYFGVVKNEVEWDLLQMKFLENHRFFTETSKASRQPVLNHHIETLKKKLQ